MIFGYNGRDGVVTDKNGLIYMRARYYSPDMRRFINADIIPGEISNAITLNRYAYANGNPVSNTDPFGLSVDSKGSVDLMAIYNMLKKIKSQKDKELASEMLASVLDQLLSFRHIVNISVGASTTINIGTNASVTYTFSGGTGDGAISDNIIISDQLDLAESFDFEIGDNDSISIESDGKISISVGYSARMNEYSTIEASVSANMSIWQMSASAEYIITMNDKYDNYVTASIELNFSTALRNKPPAFNPVRDPVYCYDPLLEKAPSAAKNGSDETNTSNGYGGIPRLKVPKPLGIPSADAMNLGAAAAFVCGMYAVAGLLGGSGGNIDRKTEGGYVLKPVS